MSFSSIFFNGDEYNQMWINNYLVWQKVDDGDVPLPSDDAYPTYDLVIRYNATIPSNSNPVITYTVTMSNKIDESLEYIDSFKFWTTYSSDNLNGVAKLKNVKYYGYTVSESGTGSLNYNFTPLKVSAPSSATDLSYLCYKVSDETDIRFIRTKNATNMSNMFNNATSTSLDLSAFRTSNVTTMDNMFHGCTYLTDLNISSFDTSNVEDMSYMFYYCPKLTSLNLSHFNTENVTDMNKMFYSCNGLTDLKLTNFNTSKVTNMSNMFNGCSKLKTLDLTSFDTSSVVNYKDMFLYVSDCTIYVSGGWTLGTDATFGGGTNLNFVLVNPITSITLDSTLTDTSIIKGTTFTITPSILPTNYSGDELVATYDSIYLSKDGDTFTVLDTATVGQELAITYSSKQNPSVSATYTVTIREAIPITSIALTHTLETLVDVEVGTTFVVEPTILPTTHDDELLVDYDTNYLSMTNNQFTVLKGAGDDAIQIIYYSKHDNNVNAILEFTVAQPLYPYEDADSVITYNNNYTSSNKTINLTIIDDTLPYSVDGKEGVSSVFLPSKRVTTVKLVNLKPIGYSTVSGAGLNTAIHPISFEQLRIPKVTDLSHLFGWLGYTASYTYSWQPQYFEFSDSVTNMSYMFYYCQYLTQEMMEQFMPYFPSTRNVTNMKYMFSNCSSLTSLDLSNFNTRNVTDMHNMFDNCSSLTSLDVSNFNTEKVMDMSYMFGGCSSLTSLDLTFLNTANVTNMNYMFNKCTSLKTLDLSSFDTKTTTTNYMFNKVANCTIYINTDKWTLGTDANLLGGTNLTFVPVVVPITSIDLSIDVDDVTNVAQETFTINPIIYPSNYSSDLEVIYDSTYIETHDNKTFSLIYGCQGQTLDITYRSRTNNSISNTLTFTVSEDLEIINPIIDFTQSTAPTLPDYMTVYKNNTYSFSHGLYTTDVYGLIPSNKGKNESTAYTCYKYVAPKSGALTFTYRCSAETKYDYLTVHVNTSTSKPSTTSTTNQVFTTKDVSKYADTDGTASVSVVEGTTYYIHIQYYKDSSTSSGYDMGCIRTIEIK